MECWVIRVRMDGKGRDFPVRELCLFIAVAGYVSDAVLLVQFMAFFVATGHCL